MCKKIHKIVFIIISVVIPTIGHPFAYEDQEGNISTGGTIPIIWNINDITMNLNFGAPLRPLLNGTTSWDINAQTALQDWNNVATPFQWQIGSQITDVCNQSIGTNNAIFSSTLCGTPFGDAIAVTRLTYIIQSNGTRVIRDTDVILDANLNWDAYDGNLRFGAGNGILLDLRRITLHEFGHALGLAHPDDAGQNVSAIMRSSIGNIDRLTTDDVAGIRTIYDSSTGGASKPNDSKVSRVGSLGFFTLICFSIICIFRRVINSQSFNRLNF